MASCLRSPPAAPRQGSLCECRIGFPHAFNKDFPNASRVPGTLGGTRVHYGVRQNVAPWGDRGKSRVKHQGVFQGRCEEDKAGVPNLDLGTGEGFLGDVMSKLMDRAGHRRRN